MMMGKTGGGGGHAIEYIDGTLEGLRLNRWANNVMLYVDNKPLSGSQMYFQNEQTYAGRFIQGTGYVLNTASNGAWDTSTSVIPYTGDLVRTCFIISWGNSASVFEGVKYSTSSTKMPSFYSQFTTLLMSNTQVHKVVVGVVTQRDADLAKLIEYIDSHKVMELVPWEMDGQKGMLDLMGTICPLTGTSFYI